MNYEQRSRLLKILSGSGRVMVTSDGCGGGLKLVYRVYYPPTSKATSILVTRDGKVISGGVDVDRDLLSLASLVISELSQFLLEEGGDDE